MLPVHLRIPEGIELPPPPAKMIDNLGRLSPIHIQLFAESLSLVRVFVIVEEGTRNLIWTEDSVKSFFDELVHIKYFPDLLHLAPEKNTGQLAATAYPHAKKEQQEVLRDLVSHEKRAVADRLYELTHIARESSDDFDELDLESMKLIASFFIRYNPPFAPHGQIVAGEDGILGIEWRLPLIHPPDSQWKNCDGILFTQFLPSGEIVFAGETRPAENEVGFYDLGTGSHQEVIDRIAPFFKMLRMIDAGQ